MVPLDPALASSIRQTLGIQIFIRTYIYAAKK